MAGRGEGWGRKGGSRRRGRDSEGIEVRGAKGAEPKVVYWREFRNSLRKQLGDLGERHGAQAKNVLSVTECFSFVINWCPLKRRLLTEKLQHLIIKGNCPIAPSASPPLWWAAGLHLHGPEHQQSGDKERYSLDPKQYEYLYMLISTVPAKQNFVTEMASHRHKWPTY